MNQEQQDLIRYLKEKGFYHDGRRLNARLPNILTAQQVHAFLQNRTVGMATLKAIQHQTQVWLEAHSVPAWLDEVFAPRAATAA